MFCRESEILLGREGWKRSAEDKEKKVKKIEKRTWLIVRMLSCLKPVFTLTSCEEEVGGGKRCL